MGSIEPALTPGFVGKHHGAMSREELLEFIDMLVTISQDRGIAIRSAVDALHGDNCRRALEILAQSI